MPRALIALVYLVATAPMVSGAEKPVATTLLLTDTRFEHGFTVWSPKPGSHVKQGTIRPDQSDSKPVWGLAQWHSRFTLAGVEPERMPGGAVRFSDGAKSVTFFPEGSEADIALGLQGILEYEGKSPKRGDPWPHLLAERNWRPNLPSPNSRLCRSSYSIDW